MNAHIELHEQPTPTTAAYTLTLIDLVKSSIGTRSKLDLAWVQLSCAGLAISCLQLFLLVATEG
jgi:hypothetical protein